MRVISVWTAKGGVGKTTAVVNVAAELARRGVRVLVVDLDPQASATIACGVPQSPGLLAALRGVIPLSSLIVETKVDGVSLIPGSRETAKAELGLASEPGRETLLRGALASLGESDELVLLDAPPGVGLLAVSSLVAADNHLAPVVPDPLSIAGLVESLDLADQVRERMNPRLASSRILLSRVPRTRGARIASEALRKRFGEMVLPVVIPERAAIPEAIAARVPVGDYDPNSPVAEAFATLAAELEKP